VAARGLLDQPTLLERHGGGGGGCFHGGAGGGDDWKWSGGDREAGDADSN
jgi:hypothetical protein